MQKPGLNLSWMLGAALLMVGCGNGSSQVDPCLSALRIDLDIVSNIVVEVEGPEVVINEVLWEITGPTLDGSKAGTIDTSDPNATASVEVYGLLPGNYMVELEATTEDGETTCRGSANFDVTVGVATDIAVLLRCSPGERYGAVRADGWFNICSELAWGAVAPLETSVGNAIIVSAMAQDEDGDDIQYSWTASNGSFADPSAAATFYTCEQTGSDTITVTVSDDGSEYCTDIWSVPVDCVDEDGTGGTGGNGTGGTGGTGGGSGGSGGSGTGGAGGVGGAGGGTGGAGGAGGAGGTGGGAGGAGGSATGGVGGNGTGGVGGNGTGGVGGNGTGGTGNSSGTAGTPGIECLVSLTVN